MAELTPVTTWLVTPTLTYTHASTTYTRPDALASLPQMLDRVSRTLRRAGAAEGLVLLDREAAHRLHGLDQPPLPGGGQYAVRHAQNHGWSATKWGPLMTFYPTAKGSDRAEVHVGQLALLDEKPARDWPFGLIEREDGPPARRWPPDMVAALQHWQRIAGLAWRAGPGVLGVNLMRQLMPDYRVRKGGHSDQREVVLVDDATPDEAGPATWTPALWRNRSAKGTFAHGYDRRRAGLTAARSALLAVGKLTRGHRRFDPSRAGWWLVSVPPWNVPELPHPFGPRPVWERAWVTTSDMALAAELHGLGQLDMPEVIDALTAPGRTLLEKWAVKLEGIYQHPGEDAYGYDADDHRPVVQAAANQVARAGIGMLAHRDRDGQPGSIVFREDWAAEIGTVKRVNGWRRAWKIWDNGKGPAPYAVDDDCWYYRSDINNREQAAPKGLEITKDVPGAYRAKYTIRAREMADA